MEQVLFGGYPYNLVNTATYWNSLVGGGFWHPAELWVQKVVSTDGVIKKLRVRLAAAPGVGKKYTFTLILNTNPTALTFDIAGLDTTGSNLVDEIVVTGGDTVSLQCTPTGTPTASYASWTSVFEGDNPNESLILGGSYRQLDKTQIEYGQVMGAFTEFTTTEINYRQVVPTSGTIKNFYVKLSSDPGTAPDAYRLTLRKGLPMADTVLVVTIVANDKTGNDLLNTVDVVAGDVLTMKIEPLNTPSSVPRTAWGFTFVADIDGESIVLGGSHNNLPQVATEHNLLTSREENTWTLTEALRYQLGQACILKKLHFLLTGSPGAGNKYDFTLRVAGAGGTVVTTIADAATTGNSGALEDTVADGKYVNLRVVPTSSPAIRDAYWGFVCYIIPPVDGSVELFGEFVVRHSAIVNLPAEFTVRQIGIQDLFADLVIRQTGTADLKAVFRVRCSRRFGGNWQRKMWHQHPYYWRARYCPAHDQIEFEYIAEEDLASNVWTENANAAIDASGFTGIDADFTVRGQEIDIPTTIHYSDGVDTWIAESNEASPIGWAWQNLTKLFDGTAPDYYRKVNLAANRKAVNPVLWASAVFYDQSEGKQWVKTREQSISGDITGWDTAVDVSNVDNTDTIYGSSVRSMGDTGAERDDMIWVYKEGVAIRSRYFTGATWKAIQDVDTTTLPGRAIWDLEHIETAGQKMAHIVYVDADGSVQWRERDAGAAEAWSAPSQLASTFTDHLGVGIVEHGNGWSWTIWVHGNILEYRLHVCDPEFWWPLLVNDPLTFDPSTDAVITTSTIEQPQTLDRVDPGDAVPITWVGQTVPGTPCALGWGILWAAAEEDLFAKFNVRQSASEDLKATFDVGQNSEDLLAKFAVRQKDSQDLFADLTLRRTGIADLFADFTIKNTGAEDLFSKLEVRSEDSQDLFSEFTVRHSAYQELFSKFHVCRSKTVELFAKFVVRNADVEDLFAKFVVAKEGFQNLFAKFETFPAVDLFATFVVRRETFIRRRLYCKFIVQHTTFTDLKASFKITQATITQDLFCQLFVNQYNAWMDLLGKFYVRPDQLMIAKFDTKTPGSMTIRTNPGKVAAIKPAARKMAVRKPARKSSRWLR